MTLTRSGLNLRQNVDYFLLSEVDRFRLVVSL